MNIDQEKIREQVVQETIYFVNNKFPKFQKTCGKFKNVYTSPKTFKSFLKVLYKFCFFWYEVLYKFVLVDIEFGLLWFTLLYSRLLILVYSYCIVAKH